MLIMLVIWYINISVRALALWGLWDFVVVKVTPFDELGYWGAWLACLLLSVMSFQMTYTRRGVHDAVGDASP